MFRSVISLFNLSQSHLKHLFPQVWPTKIVPYLQYFCTDTQEGIDSQSLNNNKIDKEMCQRKIFCLGGRVDRS